MRGRHGSKLPRSIGPIGVRSGLSARRAYEFRTIGPPTRSGFATSRCEQESSQNDRLDSAACDPPQRTFLSRAQSKNAKTTDLVRKVLMTHALFCWGSSPVCALETRLHERDRRCQSGPSTPPPNHSGTPSVSLQPTTDDRAATCRTTATPPPQRPSPQTSAEPVHMDATIDRLAPLLCRASWEHNSRASEDGLIKRTVQ